MHLIIWSLQIITSKNSKLERSGRNIITIFKLAHALKTYPHEIIKIIEEKSNYE